jgi:hypothetical protein
VLDHALLIVVMRCMYHAYPAQAICRLSMQAKPSVCQLFLPLKGRPGGSSSISRLKSGFRAVGAPATDVCHVLDPQQGMVSALSYRYCCTLLCLL